MADTQLEAWVEGLAGELGLDTGIVDVARLVELARRAGTATPDRGVLATFLVGLAVGRAADTEDGYDEGAAAMAFDDAMRVAQDAAELWAREASGGGLRD